MLQLQSAKSVDLMLVHQMIHLAPYDTVIANQPPPRVLVTHPDPDWLSPNFRLVVNIYINRDMYNCKII